MAETKSEGAHVSSALLAMAGAIACALALPVQWVRIEVGFETFSVSAMELRWFRWVAAMLVGALLLAVITQTVVWPRRRNDLGVAVALCLSGISGVAILSIEWFGSLVPRDLIPTTFRRTSFQTTSSVGLWVMFLGSIVAAVACSGRLLAREVPLWSDRGRPHLSSGAIGLFLLVVGAVGLGWARYQSTASGSALGQKADLVGWATPYYGPGTLIILWVIVISGSLYIVRPNQISALTIATAAWASSFLAATLLIAGNSLVNLRLLDRLPRRVGEVDTSDLDVSIGRGPMLVYVASVVLAGSAFLLFIARSASREGAGR